MYVLVWRFNRRAIHITKGQIRNFLLFLLVCSFFHFSRRQDANRIGMLSLASVLPMLNQIELSFVSHNYNKCFNEQQQKMMNITCKNHISENRSLICCSLHLLAIFIIRPCKNIAKLNLCNIHIEGATIDLSPICWRNTKKRLNRMVYMGIWPIQVSVPISKRWTTKIYFIN